jgi:transcriptional regulator with XRE-family HTH domain
MDVEVRERLRLLLRQRGVNQAELARRLNVHPMWVSDRLRGHSGISAEDIPALARAIRMPVGDFCRALFDEESEDYDRRREELTREGYDLFRALGHRPGQSIDQGSVLDAIRELLREYDAQRGIDE